MGRPSSAFFAAALADCASSARLRLSTRGAAFLDTRVLRATLRPVVNMSADAVAQHTSEPDVQHLTVPVSCAWRAGHVAACGHRRRRGCAKPQCNQCRPGRRGAGKLRILQYCLRGPKCLGTGWPRSEVHLRPFCWTSLLSFCTTHIEILILSCDARHRSKIQLHRLEDVWRLLITA